MTLSPTRFVATVGAWLLCILAAWSPLTAEPIAPGTLGTPATEAEDQPQEVKDAIAYFKQRNLDATLKKLQEATAKNKDLPPAEVIMADLFAQIRQAKGVRAYLEEAVAKHPDDPEAFVILGDLALPERRVTEASLLYAKASALLQTFSKSPTRKERIEPRVMGGLAAVAEARQDWSAAQKHLEDWLRADPDNTVAMQRLARALFKQRDAAGALAQLKAAAAANPKVLTPGALLARFYQEADDTENAAKWMKYALQVAPDDLRTWLVAGKWALDTGQLALAQQYAAKATELDSRSLDAKILRGVVALFDKDYRKAEVYFESAHLQSPANFAAKNNLALALAEQEEDTKRRRALEYAQDNARQYENSTEALSTYGWVLYRLGRVAEADRVLNRLARSGNFKADTAYYIARVAVDSGRTDEAKELLAQALKTKEPFSQRQEAQALYDQLNR